ncbi:hypothetical protein VTK56DRAFT_3777 [Thermocarpiscus australiensis]
MSAATRCISSCAHCSLTRLWVAWQVWLPSWATRLCLRVRATMSISSPLGREKDRVCAGAVPALPPPRSRVLRSTYRHSDGLNFCLPVAGPRRVPLFHAPAAPLHPLKDETCLRLLIDCPQAIPRASQPRSVMTPPVPDGRFAPPTSRNRSLVPSRRYTGQDSAAPSRRCSKVPEPRPQFLGTFSAQNVHI